MQQAHSKLQQHLLIFNNCNNVAGGPPISQPASKNNTTKSAKNSKIIK